MNNHSIQITRLSKNYGDKTVLNNIELQLEYGKLYGLIGRNGSGKSTLINILASKESSSGGYCDFPQNAQVAYTSSDLDYPDYIRIVQLAGLFSNSHHNWSQAKFDDILNIFSLSSDSRYGDLSTGEKAGVKLAVLIAQQANIWLIDEATLGIDIVAQSQCAEAILKYFSDDAPCVVFCSHQMAEIERLADEVIILEQGDICWHQDKEALTTEQQSLSASVYEMFSSAKGVAL